MAINYKDFQVETLPASIYYIPNFITETEEKEISENIYKVPKPKWTCLSNRRLQDYGGIPHKNGMLQTQIPNWLDKYMQKVNVLGVFNKNTSNHVLINEYLPGQGIMAHTDGPLFYPTVTTINCLSHTIIEFQHSKQTECLKILLEPRSLFIVQDDMYTSYLHSISELTSDVITEDIANLQQCNKKYRIGDHIKRDTRLSVTIRYVPKVAKIKLF